MIIEVKHVYEVFTDDGEWVDEFDSLDEAEEYANDYLCYECDAYDECCEQEELEEPEHTECRVPEAPYKLFRPKVTCA